MIVCYNQYLLILYVKTITELLLLIDPSIKISFVLGIYFHYCLVDIKMVINHTGPINMEYS